MYFNNNNKFFHGIMFHHFHDGGIHKKGQGSIDKDEFYKLLKFIGRNNILDADIFFERLKKNKLKEKDVCLTFDDAIKCQIDVALPILEELKIKSFFFVYSSMFEGKPDYLEIYRYFRMNYFKNIDEFYQNFYQNLGQDLNKFFEEKSEIIMQKKIKHPVYSIEDIKFRLVRDFFLNQSQYDEIMISMIKEKKFNFSNFYKKLFFQKDDLKNLDKLGHLVGIHSHNHPTLLEKLSYDEQKYQYDKCQSTISNILNKPKNDINFMSHPCGSYNEDTLKILKELRIELGFKQIMTLEPEKGMRKIHNSCLEIARQNHSEVLKRMN